MMHKQVFISYRHDTPESPNHAKLVHKLGIVLREQGLTVMLDQLYLESNPGASDDGWPKWCEEQATKSECIVIVASEAWFAAYEGDHLGETKKGLGAAWEANIIRQYLFDHGGHNKRIRMVYLHSLDKDKVPEALRRWHTFSPLDNDDDLRQLSEWIAMRTDIKLRSNNNVSEPTALDKSFVDHDKAAPKTIGRRILSLDGGDTYTREKNANTDTEVRQAMISVLAKALKRVAREALQSVDITNRTELEHAILKIKNDPVLTTKSGTTNVRIHDALLSESLNNRGLHMKDAIARLEKCKDIHIMTAPVNGASIVFYYLKMCNYPIHIDFVYVQGSDIPQDIIKKKISPDLIVGGEGLLAEVGYMGLGEKYVIWEILSYINRSLISLNQLRINHSGYFCYPQNKNCGLSLLMQRMILRGEVPVGNWKEKQPHDALLSIFGMSSDPDANYPVDALQAAVADEISEISGLTYNNKKINDDSLAFPVTVLCKQSFLRRKVSEDLRTAIRRAWMVLRANDNLISDTIDFMLKDNDFLIATRIISGLDGLYIKRPEIILGKSKD